VRINYQLVELLISELYPGLVGLDNGEGTVVAHRLLFFHGETKVVSMLAALLQLQHLVRLQAELAGAAAQLFSSKRFEAH
jgi:hypothetical protein